MNALRPLLIGLVFSFVSFSVVFAAYPDLGPTFFSPQLSPDGTRYLWESLERGGSLWITNDDGEKLEYIARGHSPSWIDNDSIKFVRSVDDGHQILERSLYRYSLEDGVAVHLADSENPDYHCVFSEPKFHKGPLGGKTVVLDPGHGKNSGAYSKHTSKFEDYYVLQSANVVRDYLERMGATVKMTRMDNSICPALSSRVNFSNSMGATSFCSIHYNSASNEAAHGLEVFYRSYNATSKSQARKVHDKMKEQTGLYSRGVKGDKEVLGFYLGVLSSSHKTSMRCLTEGAFLSNKEDAFKVNDPVFNSDLSYGIYAGLCDMLGVEPLDKTTSEVIEIVDGFTPPIVDGWVGAEVTSVDAETPTSDGFALLMTSTDDVSALRIGSMGWKNYEVSATMLSLDGPAVPYGLVARCSSKNELSTIAYILTFDEETNQATLYASLGDVSSMVAIKGQIIANNREDEWHEFVIRCNDDEVTASVDGVSLEALEVTSNVQQAIASQIQFGKVGLYLDESKEETRIIIDEFKVAPLSTNCP